jgi:DNA repair protein RecO
MEILKTTGIALSSHASGEADLLCNYYTREFGKRRFIFKGLKKSRRRHRSAVEPGAIARLVYYYRRDREVHVVNEFSVERFYPSLTEDLSRIMHLCFMLESVEKTSGFDMPDESTYILLRAGIEELARTVHAPCLTAFFILRLLQNIGIIAAPDTCRICGSARFSAFKMDMADFAPVCAACCALNSPNERTVGCLMRGNARGFMAECLEKKFSSIDPARYRSEDILDILFSASLFIEAYFHTELKSKQFILSERFNREPVGSR